MQTLQGQTAAASSELQAANAAFQKERATWQQQQQTWQAQQAQHADILRQHQADNRAPMAEQKQQWEAERAQREAQAQLEFKRKRADERESWRRRWEAERAQREAQAELEFKHKQQQWEAERAAQAQHAQQLQAEMAAMKADLEQYKTALAAAQQDTGSALTSGGASGGMPLTPYTPGHPPGGVNPGACKPDNGAASTPGTASHCLHDTHHQPLLAGQSMCALATMRATAAATVLNPWLCINTGNNSVCFTESPNQQLPCVGG